jgi:TolB-like protein/Flp pilus assembly protein TadD
MEESDALNVVIEEEEEGDSAELPSLELTKKTVASQTRARELDSWPQGVRRYVRTILPALALLTATVIGIRWYVKKPTPPSEPTRSIAVLPFSNVGGNPELDYLSDGLAEGLINSLSKLPNVRVMSRNSVFRYKRSDTDALHAAHDLGVQVVLTGRIVPRESGFSVSVELVDARDNAQIWGERYERGASDLASLHNDIAREVSSKLRTALSGAEQRRLTEDYTANSEAYHLYLKGRYHHAKVTRPGFLTSISYFKQAIEIDPTYALAYAGLADVYREMPFAGYAPSKESFPMAKAAALRALQIDPDLAEAHVVLGWVYFCYEWNWSGAEIELKRAIELNPNSSDAYLAYAHLLSNLGRGDEALQKMKSARELDPLHLMISSLEGQFLFYAKRYDEAAMQQKKTLEMDSNFWPARQGLARVFIQRGMYREAISELREAIKLSPGATEPITQLGYALAKSGNRTEARATLRSLRELAAREYVPAYNFAMIYNGLGQKEEALKYLQASVEEREVHITFANVDTRWDELRKDAAFRNLMRRVGFQQ